MSGEMRRFGPIEYADEDVIHFPAGPVGFPHATRFVLLSNESEWPFSWLQSLDDPALAFVVAPLAPLFPDYAAEVLAGHLRDADDGSVQFFGIVVLDADPQRFTVNLLAPIRLDLNRREGEQLVLDGPLSLLRQPLWPALAALRAA